MPGSILFVLVPEAQYVPVYTCGEFAIEVASFLYNKTDTIIPITI